MSLRRSVKPAASSVEVLPVLLAMAVLAAGLMKRVLSLPPEAR